MSNSREKRIRRAIETARKAATGDAGLSGIYLRRFHAAMDALRTREEGEAVYDALRDEGWYRLAADALSRSRDA